MKNLLNIAEPRVGVINDWPKIRINKGLMSSSNIMNARYLDIYDALSSANVIVMENNDCEIMMMNKIKCKNLLLS